jgi:GNAT superfamily N-acetyltransferase
VSADSHPFVIRRLAREEVGSFQAGLPAWNATEYLLRLDFQERGLAVQLVAWVGDEAVGKAMVVFPGHVEWSPSAYREGCPEIRDLEVSPAWARRGIGTGLVGAAEAEARSAWFDRIGLGVGLEPSYAAARALYEGLGYRFAHGPFVAGARLDEDDGRPIPVAGVCLYLVKELEGAGGQPS